MDRLADHVGVLRDGAFVAQLRRADLERRMRNYVFRAPPDWDAAAGPALTRVRSSGGSSEMQWMIWGEEAEVRTTLGSTGAEIRDVAPVSLEDAAVALLTRKA
jgi:hypothetical protein